jgi:hypothetical protein
MIAVIEAQFGEVQINGTCQKLYEASKTHELVTWIMC